MFCVVTETLFRFPLCHLSLGLCTFFLRSELRGPPEDVQAPVMAVLASVRIIRALPFCAPWISHPNGCPQHPLARPVPPVPEERGWKDLTVAKDTDLTPRPSTLSAGSHREESLCCRMTLEPLETLGRGASWPTQFCSLRAGREEQGLGIPRQARPCKGPVSTAKGRACFSGGMSQRGRTVVTVEGPVPLCAPLLKENCSPRPGTTAGS